jgi:hypothetical protein
VEPHNLREETPPGVPFYCGTRRFVRPRGKQLTEADVIGVWLGFGVGK